MEAAASESRLSSQDARWIVKRLLTSPASNMGAWRNTRHRLERCLPEGVTLAYAGRPAAALPATGSHYIHELEETSLVSMTLENIEICRLGT